MAVWYSGRQQLGGHCDPATAAADGRRCDPAIAAAADSSLEDGMIQLQQTAAGDSTAQRNKNEDGL